MRLRTPGRLCKPRGTSRICQTGCLLIALAILGPLAACRSPATSRTLTLTDLENAPPAHAVLLERAVVSDAHELKKLCTQLGVRLGLIEVRSPRDWQRLAGIAPGVGRCPNLRHGMVVGIASWAGLPANGRWPIHLDGVNVRDGAGLVKATFEPGTYLPDGTTYLETAYVEGLRAVLAVDVNGTTFYPD